MPDRSKVRWSQLKVGVVGLAAFAILAVLMERHPRLFAERSANRRRSPAPYRCKLLLPLIDRLPLGDYTKQRLFRLVNRPTAALRARL